VFTLNDYVAAGVMSAQQAVALRQGVEQTVDYETLARIVQSRGMDSPRRIEGKVQAFQEPSRDVEVAQQLAYPASKGMPDRRLAVGHLIRDPICRQPQRLVDMDVALRTPPSRIAEQHRNSQLGKAEIAGGAGEGMSERRMRSSPPSGSDGDVASALHKGASGSISLTGRRMVQRQLNIARLTHTGGVCSGLKVRIDGAGLKRPPSLCGDSRNCEFRRRQYRDSAPSAHPCLRLPASQGINKILIFLRKTGAGDGIRTHDPNLGKIGDVLFWGCP